MTMVEKMARAIAEAEGAEPDASAYPEISQFRVWETFKPPAIAALRAMREPSEEMREAARKEHGFDLYTYQAMIDAAIAEGEH